MPNWKKITFKQDIVINPNAMAGNVISLQFNNMPSGIYQVKLINNLGQVLLSKRVVHTEENSTEALLVNKNVAKGVYNLNVAKSDNIMLSIKLFY